MSYNYHREEKHSSKQVVPITYKLEKRVSPAGTFKSLWVVSFQTKQKNVLNTLVCLSLFCISRGKKTKAILLVRGKLGFLYVLYLISQTVKKQQFKMLVAFSPIFVVDTKKNFFFNFITPLMTEKLQILVHHQKSLASIYLEMKSICIIKY